MNELIVVLLSSFTTLFAVFLKSKLDKKREAEVRDDFWGFLKSGNVKKVEIKFKSNEGSDFSYISKGSCSRHDLKPSRLQENFIHNNFIGISLFSEDDISESQKSTINKYLNQIERRI